MPKKNTQTNITFFVYNNQTGAPVTGQTSSQLSVFISQNGGAFSQIPSPTIQQTDTVRLPGFYRLTLAAGDTNAEHILLCFESSTANVTAEPYEIYFDSYAVPGDIPAAPTFPTVTDIQDGLATSEEVQAISPVKTENMQTLTEYFLSYNFANLTSLPKFCAASFLKLLGLWRFIDATEIATLKTDGTSEHSFTTQRTDGNITEIK